MLATAELPDLGTNAETCPLESLVAEYQRTQASETFDAIHARCRGLVRFAARSLFRRYGWAKAHADEVLAVGVQALWRAAIHYRPDGGAKFTYYAHECMRLHMTGYVQRTLNQKRVLSLDAVYDDGDTLLDEVADWRHEQPEDEPDNRDRPARLLGIVKRYCPKRQGLFIRLKFFEGQTLQVIADQHGVTRERVRQIIGKGLARLARVIEDPKTLQIRLAWQVEPEVAAETHGPIAGQAAGRGDRAGGT